MFKKTRIISIVLLALASVSSTLVAAPPCQASVCGPTQNTGTKFGWGATCQDALDDLDASLGDAVFNACLSGTVCFEQHFLNGCAYDWDEYIWIANGSATFKCGS